MKFSFWGKNEEKFEGNFMTDFALSSNNGFDGNHVQHWERFRWIKGEVDEEVSVYGSGGGGGRS